MLHVSLSLSSEPPLIFRIIFAPRTVRFFGTLKERLFLQMGKGVGAAIRRVVQKEWLWSNDFLPCPVHRTRSGIVRVTGDTRGRDGGNPGWLRKEEASERISVRSHECAQSWIRRRRLRPDIWWMAGYKLQALDLGDHVPRNWTLWPHAHCLPILPQGLPELSLSSSCRRQSRRNKLEI